MEDIEQIHWHDCEMESVVEVPDQDMLVFNVQYPENLEQNKFAPRAIVFPGYHAQEVHEILFKGNPTILSASQEKGANDYMDFRIETNAGFRIVTAKSVSVCERVSI